MKIGKTRLDLHETFTKVLYDLNKDYKQLNKIIERMDKRGYLMGDIQPILTLNTPLDVVQSMDLYTLVYEIHQETKDRRKDRKVTLARKLISFPLILIAIFIYRYIYSVF